MSTGEQLTPEDFAAFTSTAHFSESPAPTARRAQPFGIRPLGDQIIIRLIQPNSVGSVILPDSAKRITHQGEDDGPGSGSEELQYVNRWLFEDMTESLKRILDGVPITPVDRELLGDLVFRANRSLLPKNATGIIPQNGAGLNFVEAEVVAVGPGKLAKDPELLLELVETIRRIIPNMVDGPLPPLEDLLDLIERAERTSRVPMNVELGQHVWYHPAVQRFDRQIALGDGETYFIIREESVLAVRDPEE